MAPSLVGRGASIPAPTGDVRFRSEADPEIRYGRCVPFQTNAPGTNQFFQVSSASRALSLRGDARLLFPLCGLPAIPSERPRARADLG